MLSTKHITADIPEDSRIKFEIYAFIKIISTFFDLKPYQEEEISVIFKSTWPYRISLYNRMKYENVLLGICAYVMINDDKFNVYTMIPHLYREDKRIYNSKQIYTIVQMLTDILNQ